MRAKWRTLFIVVSLPVALGVACDPAALEQRGNSLFHPRRNSETGRTLEIRLVPGDGKPFDPGTADLVVEIRHRAASWGLAEIEFPFHYDIGGGLGNSEHEHWRVVAWIAESEDVTRPNPGEWYGTRDFTAEDCGSMISGYCGMMLDVDLEIEFVRAGDASHRVASEPEPGEYIEKTYGNYTLRCMEGIDVFRQIDW